MEGGERGRQRDARAHTHTHTRVPLAGLLADNSLPPGRPFSSLLSTQSVIQAALHLDG